jgi:hypothetical protein
VGRSVVRGLVEEKTPKVLQALPDGGAGSTTRHVLFAPAGFTDPAQAEAQAHKATLVDLAALDRDLEAVA